MDYVMKIFEKLSKKGRIFIGATLLAAGFLFFAFLFENLALAIIIGILFATLGATVLLLSHVVERGKENKEKRKPREEKSVN